MTPDQKHALHTSNEVTPRRFTGAVLLLTAIFLNAVLSTVGHAQPGPCATPEHRQFDFWLGDWRVTTPDKALAGDNRIQLAHGDCVLTEHYSTPGGVSGESLTMFDRVTGQWHQTWVDNTGQRLQLDGHYENGSMVLSGAGKDGNGKDVIHRISWTPLENQTVRQHWETREAGTVEWQTVFEGLYTRTNN